MMVGFLGSRSKPILNVVSTLKIQIHPIMSFLTRKKKVRGGCQSAGLDFDHQPVALVNHLHRLVRGWAILWVVLTPKKFQG